MLKCDRKHALDPSDATGLAAVAPGEEYFADPTMVEYLLAKKKAHDGYYLAQPYDVDKKTDPSGVRGFSAASLEATTKALVKVGRGKG